MLNATLPNVQAETSINVVSLPDYFKMLEKADWFYYFSDSRDTLERGLKQISYLESLSTLSKEHSKLFETFSEHSDNVVRGSNPRPLRIETILGAQYRAS